MSADKTLIEQAMCNYECYAGLRENNPVLADFMDTHRDDLVYMTGASEWHKRVFRDHALCASDVYRFRRDCTPERKWWFLPPADDRPARVMQAIERPCSECIEVTAEYAKYLETPHPGKVLSKAWSGGAAAFVPFVNDGGSDYKEYRWCELPETFTPGEVKLAIRAFLDYGEQQFMKSQHGYFSGTGFAARALRFHLDRLEAGDKKG